MKKTVLALGPLPPSVSLPWWPRHQLKRGEVVAGVLDSRPD
jgi:hypothetical protein